MRKTTLAIFTLAALIALPLSAEARGHGGGHRGGHGFGGHHDSHRHVYHRDGHRWGGRERRHYHYCRSWRAGLCIAWAAVPVEAAIEANGL